MKKIILTTLLSIVALTSFAQVQEVMVIEKSDNSKVTLNVNDVSRVIFESIYVNPTGKVAEAVDLGLPSGVKWASWNLGASSESEYGGYYGWADPTGTKSSTDTDDYPSKNPPQEISGTEYDVAKALWGGEWRLPTFDDIKEIYNKCEWSISGKNMKAVGPNGNSIIFPLSGYRDGTEIQEKDNYGLFWSGTLDEEDNTFAWLVELDMKEMTYGLGAWNRRLGLSVRPVYGQPKPEVTITTNDAKNITENSATVSGKVNGVKEPVSVTITYTSQTSVKIISFEFVTTAADGSFLCTLKGLDSETPYEYFASYKQEDGSFIDSEKKTFTTQKATTGTLNGHDWVDLGLPSGIKWATCNVGATTPSGYGNYYAWGETSTKSKYAWSTYKYYKSSSKTCTELGDDISGTSYDVAHENWKGDWCMPSLSDFKELVVYSDVKWGTKNGVKGHIITGPNGLSIFFPAGGSYDWDDNYVFEKGENTSKGQLGFYWSSTISSSSNFAYILSLADPSYGHGFDLYHAESVSQRREGMNIRAVIH